MGVYPVQKILEAKGQLAEQIKAPSHLSKATQAWWRAIVNDYALEPHHLRLLTLAGESWDRAQQARRVIAAAGPYFADRFGQPRAHPAVDVERQSALAYARLIRELALDVELPRESRPPRQY